MKKFTLLFSALFIALSVFAAQVSVRKPHTQMKRGLEKVQKNLAPRLVALDDEDIEDDDDYEEATFEVVATQLSAGIGVISFTDDFDYDYFGGDVFDVAILQDGDELGSAMVYADDILNGVLTPLLTGSYLPVGEYEIQVTAYYSFFGYYFDEGFATTTLTITESAEGELATIKSFSVDVNRDVELNVVLDGELAEGDKLNVTVIEYAAWKVVAQISTTELVTKLDIADNADYYIAISLVPSFAQSDDQYTSYVEDYVTLGTPAYTAKDLKAEVDENLNVHFSWSFAGETPLLEETVIQLYDPADLESSLKYFSVTSGNDTIVEIEPGTYAWSVIATDGYYYLTLNETFAEEELVIDNGDHEAPVINSIEIESVAPHSVVLKVDASDNETDFSDLKFSLVCTQNGEDYGSLELNASEDYTIALTGFMGGTTYQLDVVAIDYNGNKSETVVVEFTTTVFEPVVFEAFSGKITYYGDGNWETRLNSEDETIALIFDIYRNDDQRALLGAYSTEDGTIGTQYSGVIDNNSGQYAKEASIEFTDVEFVVEEGEVIAAYSGKFSMTNLYGDNYSGTFNKIVFDIATYGGDVVEVVDEEGYPAATALDEVVNTNAIDLSEPLYNVLGQKVGANYQGVLIQKGQKFIVR